MPEAPLVGSADFLEGAGCAAFGKTVTGGEGTWADVDRETSLANYVFNRRLVTERT